jgi:hypothetical protein
MPANTSRGYTYPLYSDTQNFPAQIQDLAQDIDADVQAVYNQIQQSYDQPAAHITAAGQVIPSNVSTTCTFSSEDYDNDGMVDLGVNNTRIQIQTPGIYLLNGFIRILGNGNATLSGAGLTLASSGGIIGNPALSSKRLDNDKKTAICATTLHITLAAGDNITMFVRHNNPASVTLDIAELSATRFLT